MIDLSHFYNIINMTVKNLFIKSVKKQPLEARSSLRLKGAYGIEGDVNAHGASPRQILVVRAEDIEPLDIKAGQLRENIVVEGLSLDEFQPGTCLHIGEAKIRLTYQCEPCHTVKHLVDDLSQLDNKRGILGVIISGGAVKVGDEVKADVKAYPVIKENHFELFKYFVTHIPEGKVATYQDAIKGMGGYSAFLKKIPSYVEKLGSDYPVHRIVNDQGELTDYIDNQAIKLRKEGVNVENGKVQVAEYHWAAPALFMEE